MTVKSAATPTTAAPLARPTLPTRQAPSEPELEAPPVPAPTGAGVALSGTAASFASLQTVLGGDSVFKDLRPTPSGGSAAPSSPEPLKLGSRGPEVTRLKTALRDAGFYDGAINDELGPMGLDALKRAKAALKLGGPADVAGPTTIEALERSVSKAGADFGAQLRSADVSKTPIYRAIGLAEGTIAADGTPTSAWYGHDDPGNRALNRGFGSYQVYQDPRGASLTPQQADRIQADRLAAQWPAVDAALTRAGFPQGPQRALVAANALDAWNQAPATHGGRNGLLNPQRLAELKQKLDAGASPLDAVVDWRVRGYREDDGRLNAPGFGNSLGALREDQLRRATAVQAGLKQVAPPPGPTASGGSAPPPPAPALDPQPTSLLGQGAKGADVTALQRALNARGAKLEVDGLFGPDTERAVREYQRANGLDVDGLAGPDTLGSLWRGATAGSPTPSGAPPEPSAAGPTPSGAPTAANGLPANVNQDALQKLATASLRGGADHSCVATTLGNLDRLGVPSFQGGTAADPNNARGAMVQMIKGGRWTSVALPGSATRTIQSPYGTVQASVLDANAYERLAKAGQIPSGAVIFQTRHGWASNEGPRGNDMGIARDGGRTTFNYAAMSPIIYSDAKEVVLLVPTR